MLKINIPSEAFTETKRGDYTFYEQEATCLLHSRDGQENVVPDKIVIQLRADKDGKVTPHKIGNYRLSLGSIYKTRFNQLDLGTLQLIPVAAQVQKVA